MYNHTSGGPNLHPTTSSLDFVNILIVQCMHCVETRTEYEKTA